MLKDNEDGSIQQLVMYSITNSGVDEQVKAGTDCDKHIFMLIEGVLWTRSGCDVVISMDGNTSSLASEFFSPYSSSADQWDGH
jgi:hypothetical protein